MCDRNLYEQPESFQKKNLPPGVTEHMLEASRDNLFPALIGANSWLKKILIGGDTICTAI